MLTQTHLNRGGRTLPIFLTFLFVDNFISLNTGSHIHSLLHSNVLTYHPKNNHLNPYIFSPGTPKALTKKNVSNSIKTTNKGL